MPPADDAGHPVHVDDPDGCPVFVARTVSGLDPTAPTPDWMVRRLTQAGMRPISLAVDVTNYVMLEIGRPIHGYDADQLTGAVRVRRAQRGSPCPPSTAPSAPCPPRTSWSSTSRASSGLVA